MIAKRIIACLDIKDGRTVKGINFENLVDAGDPVELGKKYESIGIDELVFLDITATFEKRKTVVHLAELISKNISIPFSVGGGISSLDDALAVIASGADKIVINSSAISKPQLITEIAQRVGAQAVVVAIDAKYEEGEWRVYSHGGRTKTQLELFSWAQKAETMGAGELLFTSMSHDGTKNGFAIEGLKKLTEKVSVPVVASGGGGSIQHFIDVFQQAHVDAALAASIFHYQEINLSTLKNELLKKNIPIRL